MGANVVRPIDCGKAVAVIRAEQRLIHGRFVEHASTVPPLCESPGHCALGALLFAGGLTNDEIKRAGEPTEWRDGEKAKEVLEDQYGLRPFHADRIMGANDGDEGRLFGERQADVIAEIERLAAAQATDPDGDSARCDYYEERYDED